MSDEGYKRLKKQLEKALAECASLRKENASLRALLCESSREDHLEKDNIMFVEHSHDRGIADKPTPIKNCPGRQPIVAAPSE